MHVNIYNSIKVNFLNSKSVNTIQYAKKEITEEITSSCLGTYINKVSEEYEVTS